MECINNFFIQEGISYEISDFEQHKVFGSTNIYEVIRIIENVPLFFEAHIKRLNNSLKLLNRENAVSFEEVKNNINKLIKLNNNKEGNIKIIFNVDNEKIIDTYYYISHSYPSKEEYEDGVSTVLYYGERENPNAKIINNNFREEVNKVIKENKAYEAILVDREGYVTEGSRSNIFMVKGNALITSPVEKVLPGITREVIIKLCVENGVEVIERRVKDDEIAQLDGLFISGTSPKVLPICKVNNYIYNSPKNDIISLIMKKYDDFIYNYIKSYK
ncbi:aminotransferase class IV [Desnuesiella massiliensis]|uniref:aminotransferase class IV n=1 Tax=Desnuesiella massiliensis TaxID=1650662 RepID=UPI0006E2AC0D|nr:aminotransferase class IV [Desnuesiella massiliensis]